MDYKEFLKWPLVILPGGGLLLCAYYLYQNYGPGAVVTNENGIPTDFTSNATRSLRARNPLSISTSALTAKYGSVSEDNTMGDHLAIFPDTQSGLSASAQELLYSQNYFGGGNNTPQGIGDTWAGPSSTDYGVSIASNMGYQPDAVLNFAVDGIALMKAMAREENGLPAVISIPDSMYQAAVSNALNNRR